MVIKKGGWHSARSAWETINRLCPGRQFHVIDCSNTDQYRSRSMNSLNRRLVVVFLGLLAASCSDSSDSPDGFNDPPLGSETENRSIVTGVLQVVDLADFLSNTLTPSAATVQEGSVDCSGGGSTARVDTESEQQISYTDCKLTPDAVTTLNGVVSVKRDTAGYDLDVTYSQLQLEDPTRAISVDGGLGVSFVEVARIASSSDLTVTSDTDTIAITEFNFSRQPDGIGANATGNRISVSFKATMIARDVSLTVSTTQSMVSEIVTCPTGGGLTVVVDEDRTIEISGGQGGNLNFTVDGDTQTLACSEIEGVGR